MLAWDCQDAAFFTLHNLAPEYRFQSGNSNGQTRSHPGHSAEENLIIRCRDCRGSLPQRKD
jgi:hypothetical protein